MKKNLIFSQNPIMYALFALCILFTSCSVENDTPTKPEEKPATARVDYLFTIDQKLFNLVDATVVFWDDKGEKITEKMTKPTFSKEFTLTKSQEFGYVVNLAPKANIDELITSIPATLVINTTYKNSYLTSGGFKNSQSTLLHTLQKTRIKDFIIGMAEYYKYSHKWNKEANTVTE